eukprot:4355236-Ditylum_brightwellii.AAC.1
MSDAEGDSNDTEVVNDYRKEPAVDVRKEYQKPPVLEDTTLSAMGDEVVDDMIGKSEEVKIDEGVGGKGELPDGWE